MDFLGKLVQTTTDWISLELWYITAGLLISSFSFIFLSAAIVGRHPLPSYIFGALIIVGISWLGFISVYQGAEGFTKSLDPGSFAMPLVLLGAHLLITAIVILYRRRQDI
jgi:hypothetical protein